MTMDTDSAYPVDSESEVENDVSYQIRKRRLLYPLDILLCIISQNQILNENANVSGYNTSEEERRNRKENR